MIFPRYKLLISFTILVLLPLIFCGCVRRRLSIVTNPPGATVYLDNEELGKTPIKRNFVHYGTRKLTIVKDGYETHTQYIDLRTPWYQWPGLDFFSEICVPNEIQDNHYFKFNLKPQRIVSDEEFINRARTLRDQSHASGALKVASDVPVSSVPVPAPQIQEQPLEHLPEPLVPSQPGRVTPYQPPGASRPDSPFSPIYIPGSQ